MKYLDYVKYEISFSLFNIFRIEILQDRDFDLKHIKF